MKIIKLLSSEDAVSEVVDFVTVLGILTLSIGIIGVAGYPMVKNAQEANHIENTRQSFVVLADNINKVMAGQAPSQNVELKMYGESLSVIQAAARTSTINITLVRDPGNGGNVSYKYDLGAIEAEFDTAIIGYENTGAWINYSSGATIMISKPDFIIGNDSVYIPVATIGGSASTGGTGLVHLVAKEVASDDLIVTPNVKSIKIVVNSTYNEGWQQRDFNPPVNVYIQRKYIKVNIQS